jgi:hypothetical protein
MIRSNQHARWRRLIAPAILGALIAAGCGQQSGAGATAVPVVATQAPPAAATAAAATAPAIATPAPTSAPATDTPAPHYRY